MFESFQVKDSSTGRKIYLSLVFAVIATAIAGASVYLGILDERGTWFPNLARSFWQVIGMIVGGIVFVISLVWMLVRDRFFQKQIPAADRAEISKR